MSYFQTRMYSGSALLTTKQEAERKQGYYKCYVHSYRKPSSNQYLFWKDTDFSCAVIK